MSRNPELDAALDRADAGDWSALEVYTREHHTLAPDRVNTCVYLRFDAITQIITEYHRGLSPAWGEWWRTTRPAFAHEEQETTHE